MKDKLNRAVATGLLALMIANFSACDQLGQLTNPKGDTSQLDTIPINTEGNNGYYESDSNYKKVPGDVWKAMTASGKAFIEYHSNAHILPNLPIPIRFLQEEGLLYYDEQNKLLINGKQQVSNYHPFSVQTFIDENTDENDVYVLLNYKNNPIKGEADNEAHITTWKLKYTLDDDDYQALLMLKNDFRQRFFIQEMDNIYEPEVISKATYAQGLIVTGSPFRNYDMENIFPNVYIVDIDYETYTVTFGAISDKGYKYYDYNLYETNAISKAMDRHKLTEEQALENIRVKKVDTVLGESLVGFYVKGYIAGLTMAESEKRFKESTNEHVLTNLMVNSVDTTFIASK